MAGKEYLLGLIKKSVQESAPDATLILYGSYARGDYNKDSDIDLLILLNQDNISPVDEDNVTYPLYKIEFSTGTIISPMVYTQKAWAAHKVTPFYENVIKEGLVL